MEDVPAHQVLEQAEPISLQETSQGDPTKNPDEMSTLPMESMTMEMAQPAEASDPFVQGPFEDHWAWMDRALLPLLPAKEGLSALPFKDVESLKNCISTFEASQAEMASAESAFEAVMGTAQTTAQKALERLGDQLLGRPDHKEALAQKQAVLDEWLEKQREKHFVPVTILQQKCEKAKEELTSVVISLIEKATTLATKVSQPVLPEAPTIPTDDDFLLDLEKEMATMSLDHQAGEEENAEPQKLEGADLPEAVEAIIGKDLLVFGLAAIEDKKPDDGGLAEPQNGKKADQELGLAQPAGRMGSDVGVEPGLAEASGSMKPNGASLDSDLSQPTGNTDQVAGLVEPTGNMGPHDAASAASQDKKMDVVTLDLNGDQAPKASVTAAFEQIQASITTALEGAGLPAEMREALVSNVHMQVKDWVIGCECSHFKCM